MHLKCTFRGQWTAFSSQKHKLCTLKEKEPTTEIETSILCLDRSEKVEVLNKLEDKQKELERLLQDKSAIMKKDLDGRRVKSTPNSFWACNIGTPQK